jgi:Skp family chaperone for outer membrane proteins
MMQRRPFATQLLAAAAVVLAGNAALRSQAPGRAAPTVAPAVVVSIDLEKVFNALKVREQAEQRLEELAVGLEAKTKQRREHAKKLEDDLAMLAPGTPKYKETEDAYRRAANETSAMLAFGREKISREKDKSFAAIYNSIAYKCLPAFCEAHGYDFVLRNDSVAEVEYTPGEKQETVMVQIAQRRVLYTRPTFDATDALIEWITANPSCAEP